MTGEKVIRRLSRIRNEVEIVTAGGCEQCGGTGLTIVLHKTLDDGRVVFAPDVCYCAEVRAVTLDG